MPTQFCCRALAALVLPLLLLACGGAGTTPDESQERVSAVASRSGQLFAVLINGGARPRVNYNSHLDHLRRLLDLLQAAGVEPARIATFSSDGQDPGLDLATREGEVHPDFWLLPRNVATLIRPPLVFVDSEIDGFTLRPAKRRALRDWFELEGQQLAPGDTLLFYVTDHGQKNADDLTNNSINLWGEELSVSDLRELFSLLDPGVRVVMLMSQCYSGAFANAIFPDGAEALPEGNVCGYFSATADRRASGCYPEVSGKDAMGHSHRMFAAMESGRPLAVAQREVLVSDRTPDVPHTSSSFFLEQQLEQAADRGGHALPEFIDDLLREAFKDPLEREQEIRLLDRVGHAFGFASPRSLAELESQADGLAELIGRLRTYARNWERAFDHLRGVNLNEFRAEYPEWNARLASQALQALDPEQKRAETDELLAELVPFTQEAPELEARLEDLRRKRDEAKAAKYRVQVRLGVVLRMRALLTQIAGRLLMARYPSDEERSTLARLDACEDLALGVEPERAIAAESEAHEPFPTLAEERRRIEAIMPAWLGISYRQARQAERGRYQLPAGAAVVQAVLPDSPAEEAGLQVSDILLGPPGEPFLERHAVREWTMQSEPGRWVYLDLLRDGEELEVPLLLVPYPLELPAIAEPPKIASAAPKLQLNPFRGADRLEPGGARLLFFWATWCAPCKAAIPELLAFRGAQNTPIIAISDQDPEELERFFARRSGPFPEIVATDPQRAAFLRYGVSGTPTFVLVDADGIVRHYQTGYETENGLRIDGWDWDDRIAAK